MGNFGICKFIQFISNNLHAKRDKRTLNKIPSFPIKSLTCLGDLQYFTNLTEHGDVWRGRLKIFDKVTEDEKSHRFSMWSQVETACKMIMIKQICYLGFIFIQILTNNQFNDNEFNCQKVVLYLTSQQYRSWSNHEIVDKIADSKQWKKMENIFFHEVNVELLKADKYFHQINSIISKY